MGRALNTAATVQWDDERVELRIRRGLLEERGIISGEEHAELTQRIQQLERLIDQTRNPAKSSRKKGVISKAPGKKKPAVKRA